MKRALCLLCLILASMYLGFVIRDELIPPKIVYVEKPFESPINLDLAYSRMYYARNSHLGYALNPDWCNPITGNVTFHEEWVEHYEEIIKLLDYLREE